MLKQISVFVENKPGKIHGILDLLNKNGINLRALSIADTTDFGILRFIVDKPEETKQILSGAGHTAKITNVIAVKVPDVPGGLAKVLEIIKNSGHVIEYMYAFLGTKDNSAMVILRLDDMEDGAAALVRGGIELAEEI